MIGPTPGIVINRAERFRGPRQLLHVSIDDDDRGKTTVDRAATRPRMAAERPETPLLVFWEGLADEPGAESARAARRRIPRLGRGFGSKA